MSTVVDDNEARKNIAANLAHLLVERRMSQCELAAATGDSTMAVSYYVRAKRLPGAAALSRLAEALGVTMESLLAAPPKKSKKRVAS